MGLAETVVSIKRKASLGVHGLIHGVNQEVGYLEWKFLKQWCHLKAA